MIVLKFLLFYSEKHDCTEIPLILLREAWLYRNSSYFTQRSMIVLQFLLFYMSIKLFYLREKKPVILIVVRYLGEFLGATIFV